MFEIVDGRRTTYDGRTPEHGYTISSPCEPEGSGELINRKKIALKSKDECTYESYCKNIAFGVFDKIRQNIMFCHR